MEAAPDSYFITDHYLNYPWVAVRLSAVSAGALAERLEEAWRPLASKRQLAESEARG